MKKILTLSVISIAFACNAPKDKSGKVSLENDKDMVAYGQVLFSKHCQQCHGEAGVSMLPNIPDLTKTTLADADEVGNLIFHGKGNMPAFEEKLGEPEIRATALYILSLKK